MLAVTESWLSGDDGDNDLRAMCSAGYSFVHHSRGSRGGGIALIFNSMMSTQRLPSPALHSTFESLDVLLVLRRFRLRLVVIYRPPLTGKRKGKTSGVTIDNFLAEIEAFVESLAVVLDKLIVMGDFNLHVDSISSIPAKKFLTMMESYGFHQYVTGPTHGKGHTLDLVFARPDDGLISCVSVTSRISDHHAVLECRLTICPLLCLTKRVLYRQLKSIDCDAVKQDILALPLLTTPETSLDGLVAQYNDGLALLLDKHEPVKMKSIVLRPSEPWINEEIREFRKQIRKAERIWRMNKLTVSFEIYKDHAHQYSVLLKRVKSVHMQSEVAECDTYQRALYGLVNRLIRMSDVSSLPPHSSEQVLADIFGEFFYLQSVQNSSSHRCCCITE